MRPDDSAGHGAEFDLLGDVTVKRISDEVSLSQATVTTILNRLEDRGLLERVRNADDKRIVNARLTAAGWAERLRQRRGNRLRLGP